MPRFFIDSIGNIGSEISISGAPVIHMRALRLREGEAFIACDGAGSDYRCSLVSLTGNIVKAKILEKFPSTAEPNARCSVYLATSKGDRLEYATQKCVELGAAELVIFPTERSVARLGEDALVKKVTRLQAISESAAEQSGRGKIPNVRAEQSFEAAMDDAAKAEAGLFFYEQECELGVFDALEGKPYLSTISIITGAEGGFTPAEAALARKKGLQHVSLGPRILRCDTAPIAALAGVMLRLGEM
jgi:16S rRNA (uracil1498-N3)-methyltransferase